jgi:4-amino-4-deoxy-L-arabinose transferase-like glycosyltransferase
MKLFSGKRPFILLVLLLAFILRFTWLSSIPTGITDDEAIFIINAKSVFLSGSDISGKWNPLSFTPIPGLTPMAEIPSLIMSPFVGIMPLSLVTSKLPYVLVSVLIVFYIYLITRKLVGDNEAILTALIAALNPWSIFVGRTAYDAPLAVSFYLLAFLSLLYLKKWKILLAFIPLFIAFYSYIGTKVIFVPYSVLIILFSWFFWNKKRFIKQYLALGALCLLLFTYFLITLNSASTGSRLSEISSPNNPRFAKEVEVERQYSLKSPIRDVFANKYVIFGKDSIDKYFRVFSTEYLFLRGEGSSTLSIVNHGYFYYVDFIFLLIGFAVLFARNKKAWTILLGIILIAPLPSVVNNLQSGSFVLRSSMLFPILFILIGIGIAFSITYYKDKRIRLFVILALFLIYSLHLLNFLNIFFNRNPFHNSDAFSLSARVYSRYAELAREKNNEVIIVTSNPQKNFYMYLFHANALRKDSLKEIRENVNKGDYEFENVKFVNCDSNLKYENNFIYIGNATSRCGELNFDDDRKHLTIPRLSDGGPIMRIINDKVCSGVQLNIFQSDILVSDFNMEKIDRERFCRQFVTHNR